MAIDETKFGRFSLNNKEGLISLHNIFTVRNKGHKSIYYFLIICMVPFSYIFSFWIWVLAFFFMVAILNNYRYFPAPVILSSMGFMFLTIVNFILPFLNIPFRAGASTAKLSFRLYITLFELFISMLVMYLYVTYSNLALKQNTYYEILYAGIYLVWLYQHNTTARQIYVYDLPTELTNVSFYDRMSMRFNRLSHIIRRV